MPVKVSFMKPGGLGSIDAVGIGSCRVCETITVPGTTTAAAQSGEIVMIVSTEAATVICAHGSAPNAAATAQSAATTAGYALPNNMTMPVALSAGDKINIQAFA